MSNPKCPWCGEERKIYKNPFHNLWRIGCCKNKQCPSVKEEPSYELALAAASKRFMPKRSVSEIKTEWRRLIYLRDEELREMFKGKILTEQKQDSWWDISLAKLIHRIADFIYGAE